MRSNASTATEMLRSHVASVNSGVKASGASDRILRRLEVDPDGICVTVTLQRGERASGLTLIFEVRRRASARPAPRQHTALGGTRPDCRSAFGSGRGRSSSRGRTRGTSRACAPRARPPFPRRSPAPSPRALPTTQDGYPRASATASSDEDDDDSRVSTLNALLDARRGETLDLVDALTMVGVAFECAAEVEAAVAASGVIDTPARDVDPRVRPSDDDADVATTRVARSSAPVDSPEPSASSLGLGLPSDSEHDDDVHDDVHDDDVHDDDEGDAAAAVRIEADVLTRLYQNKRKCVEREERRVAARRAAEATAGAASGHARGVGGSAGAGPSSASRGSGAATDGDSAMTWDEKRAAKQQIFSSEGAFARLSSELFAMQERLDPTLSVDAVEYDVYEWDVKFRGGFPAGSGIAEDLEMLEAVNGYAYVQLRLHFKADLYPFYPPKVRLVRPKIAGFVPGAVIAHPHLHLRNWDPFRPIADVVAHLRAFLSTFARVDLACERNDPARFPEGAYDDQLSRLETSLARLASCGTSRGPALLPVHYRETYDQEAVAAAAAERTAATSTSGAFSGSLGGSSDPGTSLAPDFAALLRGEEGAVRAAAEASAKVSAERGAREDAAGPWAKGTGYGFDAKEAIGGGGGRGNGGGARGACWDAAAARTAQSAEDAAVQALVEEATRFIEAMPREGGGGGAEGVGPGARFSAPPEPEPEPVKTRTRSKSKAKGKGKGKGDAAGNPKLAAAQTPSPSFAASLAAHEMFPRARAPATLTAEERAGAEALVRGSSLCDFVARELRGCAFMDMVTRGDYYVSLLDAARALARSTCASSLLRAGGGEDRGGGVAGDASKTLAEASRQAKVYLRSLESTMAAAKDGEGRRAVGDSDEWRTQAAREAAMATRILETSDAVAAAAAEVATTTESETEARDGGETRKAEPAARGKGSRARARAARPERFRRRWAVPGREPADPGTRDPGTRDPDPEPPAPRDDEEASYRAALAAHVFDAAPLGSHHAFLSEAKADLRVGPHVTRVAREVAGLGSTLPVSAASSAFVRVDEERSVLWSVLITGPEDTPYDCGAFVFDAFFPSGYPIAAPRLKFRTTGGGRVRFNPNLYKDGKVCLSLLGTWSGAKGETWDPAVSTMLQVIVSVQSLIFVPRPYFNEPGYEQSIGTADGDAKCAEYNASVREDTLRCAVLEALRKPTPAFADAIRAHFKRRAAHILGPNVRGRWTEEAKGEAKRRIEGLFADVEKELAKL